MIDLDRYSGGALVLSWDEQQEHHPDPDAALRSAGTAEPTCGQQGHIAVRTWGRLATPNNDSSIVLSGLARGPRSSISPGQIDLTKGTAGAHSIADLMPPFGAVQITGDTALAVTDALGYRHLYQRRCDGWSAVSTSSLVLAHLDTPRMDRNAIAVQAMLGWQLGDRTLFEGVTKLRQRERVTMTGGRSLTDHYAPEPSRAGVAARDAVNEAATLLREYLVDYLDEHPDAILQLTGGIDSRILLAAIPPERRRGLRVLTLESGPGSEDVRIAGRIAERYGMRHLVQGLSGLDGFDPAEAHALVMSAAKDLNGMADPVAHAALLCVESSFPQGDRISGLGGEVARGFYYVGPAFDYPVSKPFTRTLAGWRMYANDSVAPAALNPEFSSWAREFATKEIHRVLLESGMPWLQATDELYLYERMQRWAGVTDSAVCLGRATVNPMLDPRFIAIANSLPPAAKAHARFLAQLVCRLDTDLAEIPLDGRLAPSAYASPGLRQRMANSVPMAQKARRKVIQRIRRDRRPPAGGDTLSALLAEHWRRNPELLDPVRGTQIFDNEWIDALLAGGDADPSTTALLASLVALAPAN
ncbi:hypothetical protein [Flexivirga sp. B27]